MGRDSEKSTLKSTESRKEGNKLFLQNNRQNDRIVLSLYTKSLAYAPLDSEELALAYGNRSALWLHLQKYDYCLIDIARALSITKSNDLMQKLSSRKRECLKHVSPTAKKGQKKSRLPTIANPSKSTPCRADSITVECNEKYGRHYIATRNIKPGEIVISEKTTCASVDIEHMYLVCSHCLAFAWAGIPCNSCTFTIYCSETCKEEAWSQYHEVICALYSIDSFSHHITRYLHERKTLNIGYQSLAFGLFMSSLRIMIIFLKEEGLDKILKAAEKIDQRNDTNLIKLSDDETLNCSSFKFLYSLSACRENTHECLVNFVSMLMKVFEKATSKPSKNYSNEALSSMQRVFEKLYKICETNSFKFSSYGCTCKDSEGSSCISDRGYIFAPCSALFNHSCDNNVDRIFLRGPRIMLIANRPIKKGEQLFVNYGCTISTMTQSLRQMALKSNYSFICQCIPCTEKWPNIFTDKDAVSKLFVVDQELRKRLGGKQADKFLKPPLALNEMFFNTAVGVLDFIYKKLNGTEAAANAYLYQRYLVRYLSHFYDEDVDLYHIWDMTKSLKENVAKLEMI